MLSMTKMAVLPDEVNDFAVVLGGNRSVGGTICSACPSLGARRSAGIPARQPVRGLWLRRRRRLHGPQGDAPSPSRGARPTSGSFSRPPTRCARRRDRSPACPWPGRRRVRSEPRPAPKPCRVALQHWTTPSAGAVSELRLIPLAARPASALSTRLSKECSRPPDVAVFAQGARLSVACFAGQRALCLQRWMDGHSIAPRFHALLPAARARKK